MLRGQLSAHFWLFAVGLGAVVFATLSFGLTALEDQQLAGLIMWMPACLVFAGVAAALFAAWIGSQEG
jgi:hypothetical protein